MMAFKSWREVRTGLLALASLFLIVFFPACASAAGSVVRTGKDGIFAVNGKPFFPVGLFTYSLDGNVMAEIHDLQFNTIVMLTEHHHPDQLDYVQHEGLMAICPIRENWVPAAMNHPALLAWYLDDEPEGHGQTPAEEREKYLKLKAVDANHPIGLDHFLWEGLTKYKDACDFTMTDVYPITANRDVPITNVGKFIDEARRIHGRDWPHLAYIQVFGGPETEGGKWAQPLPDEVRCMTYIALVHGANGILYFAYWPKAPRTWLSLGPLNHEIHQMSPWLIAPGTELKAASSQPQVQVRARQVGHGGILLAVNTGPQFVDTSITLPTMRERTMENLFTGSPALLKRGKLMLSLVPYETRVLTWGRRN